MPILYSFRDLKDIKKTDKNPYAEFLRKYDNYTGDYDDYRIHDLLYIVLIQYSLIDKNGHLVLPENRKRSSVPTPCHFPLPSSKDKYLNFNLLNFAKENNFTLRDDKDSAMFDMKLSLALGNNVVPTSTSSSSLALTLNNLIIENEKGEASDIDKIYLHHCSDKSIYESSSLVKNKDSDIKNSYTATFNIPIDRNDKKDTKLIVYSSDLSKIY
ncbi:hypothetical protein VB002_04730 [Campylobacter concisus]